MNCEQGLIGKQPYVFAVLRNELFEVQLFSNRVIPIAKWNAEEEKLFELNPNIFMRRSNFNGASLRISQDKHVAWYNSNKELVGSMGSILHLFQSKFNFTIVEKEFHGYGSLDKHGKWSGNIKYLIEDDIDLCELKLIINAKSYNIFYISTYGHGSHI